MFYYFKLFKLQTIDISMEIVCALFWTNLCLYKYESKCIRNLIRKINSEFEICALNDGGEFSKTFLQIYSTELELKEEHNDSHTTFLDSEISYLILVFGKG